MYQITLMMFVLLIFRVCWVSILNNENIQFQKIEPLHHLKLKQGLTPATPRGKPAGNVNTHQLHKQMPWYLACENKLFCLPVLPACVQAQ